MRLGYTPRYQLLSAGQGGVTGYARGPGASCSTTSTLYDTRLAPYLGELVEGGLVVDTRPLARHPEIVRWALDTPMVSLHLQGDAVDRCPEVPETMLGGLEGMFGLLAAKRTVDAQWSGLDRVSPAIWANLWASHGARVGQRRGDAVCWRDGSCTSIPEVEERYTPNILDNAGTT